MKRSVASITVLAVAAGMLATAAPAFANSEITATKTLDICQIDSSNYRYSGLISVTNLGTFPQIQFPTQGLTLSDCIGTLSCVIPVPGSGQTPNPNPLPYLGFALANPGDPNYVNGSIAVGATVVFKYTVDGIALAPPITNSAPVTITNFFGHLGTPFGPTATATFSGTPPLCNPTNFGCTLTIGFWKNHTSRWPAGFSPTDPWFSATMHIGTETWLSALTGGPTHKNGYWILARAYIGAVLNGAKNGSAPAGVVDAINKAAAFFSTAMPSDCNGPGSCGDQKALAGILQTYNEGKYPGGPPHCAS